MCGIAGIHRRGTRPVRNVKRLADTLLGAIEMRGRDSTGVLTIRADGTVAIVKDTVPAREFVRTNPVDYRGARTVLLHTRYATRGAVNRRNAHPVVSGPVAAVHNGTIYNDDHVFDSLAKHGIKRAAQVDSEVIPAVVQHHGWRAAAKALARLRGGAATAIVHTDHPDELILARLRDFPLVVYVTPTAVVWASTATAIEAAWKAAYGASPTGGRWIDVPEYTMLRVNGKITTERIPKPTVPGPRPKKAPRHARRATPLPPAGTTTAPVIRESVEHEVEALMRWSGMDREWAESIVAMLDDDAPDDYDRDADGWGLDGFSVGVDTDAEPC